MMAIVNGELPEEPMSVDGSYNIAIWVPGEPLGGGNSRIFDVLWELCHSCWQRSSESRPTAQDVANHLFDESVLCESNSPGNAR